MSWDVTFFKSIFFFSSPQTTLQREHNSHEGLSGLVPLPIFVSSSYFDKAKRKGEPKLKVYTRRKKTQDEGQISQDPSKSLLWIQVISKVMFRHLNLLS